MSHILEGLDQSPPSVKSVKPEAYSNEPEGSQNGRPHFKRVPMCIVMIPVHRDVPELVCNSSNTTQYSSEPMAITGMVTWPFSPVEQRHSTAPKKVQREVCGHQG